MYVVCWEVGGVEHVATASGWMHWKGGVNANELPKDAITFAFHDAAFNKAAEWSRGCQRKTYVIMVAFPEVPPAAKELPKVTGRKTRDDGITPSREGLTDEQVAHIGPERFGQEYRRKHDYVMGIAKATGTEPDWSLNPNVEMQ